MYKVNKPSKRDRDKGLKGDRLLGHIIVRHAYAARADNPRRPACFTIVTYDQSSWMFQASGAQDRDGWIAALNLAAARYSAAPLAAGLSSDPHIFRRPVFPVAIAHRSPVCRPSI
jgi:hypothetical protein